MRPSVNLSSALSKVEKEKHLKVANTVFYHFFENNKTFREPNDNLSAFGDIQAAHPLWTSVGSSRKIAFISP